MGRPGLHSRAAQTEAYRNLNEFQYNISRACPFVRRLCTTHSASRTSALPIAASRRRAPDIRAWSGSPSLNSSLVSTPGTSWLSAANQGNRLRIAVDVDEGEHERRPQLHLPHGMPVHCIHVVFVVPATPWHVATTLLRIGGAHLLGG